MYSEKVLRKNIRSQQPAGLPALPSFTSYHNIFPFHVPCECWLYAWQESDTQGQLISIYLGICNKMLSTEHMHKGSFFERRHPNTRAHRPAQVFSPRLPVISRFSFTNNLSLIYVSEYHLIYILNIFSVELD